jgi:hypothetical protein
MKSPLQFFLILLALFSFNGSDAQTPFNVYDSMDVNNINARLLVHGDMWWDPVQLESKCEYPKGSGKHIGFCGALWMAGYQNNMLKVSAQTYRQDGNDFWPGPLMTVNHDTITYAESQDWARIWKVTQDDINTFLSTPVHTLTNTPKSILEWPGMRNPYARGNNGALLNLQNWQNHFLAPYVETGLWNEYNPLEGDYPAIKGDEMAWFVFNDRGPTHNQTNSQGMKLEIQGSVYGYKRNSLIDNVIYYDYKIINFNTQTIDSFVLGVWADMDLGKGDNDYVGFDSARRLGFIYNGMPVDGTGTGKTYGDSIPMAGIRILQWNYDTCSLLNPAGSFIYTNNNSDPVTGNPTNAQQYNNLLRSRWRDGSHLAGPYGVWYNGTGPGPAVNYVYDNSQGWNECLGAIPKGDRRFIISSQPWTLTAGNVTKFSFALVASPKRYQNGCPNMVFTDIYQVADTAQKVFCNPLPALGVKDIMEQKGQLSIYPNPSSEKIFVDISLSKNDILSVYDATGRRVDPSFSAGGKNIVIDIHQLANGVYHILITKGNKVLSGSFIKE